MYQLYYANNYVNYEKSYYDNKLITSGKKNYMTPAEQEIPFIFTDITEEFHFKKGPLRLTRALSPAFSVSFQVIP